MWKYVMSCDAVTVMIKIQILQNQGLKPGTKKFQKIMMNEI